MCRKKKACAASTDSSYRYTRFGRKTRVRFHSRANRERARPNTFREREALSPITTTFSSPRETRVPEATASIMAIFGCHAPIMHKINSNHFVFYKTVRTGTTLYFTFVFYIMHNEKIKDASDRNFLFGYSSTMIADEHNYKIKQSQTNKNKGPPP